MFGKRGINGTYYAICLLIGLILGVILALWLAKNGYVDPNVLPF